ncbi:hypothetical protein [Thioclava kandeliae]|uniref:Uncharacterized protein n=1 Tax=Thioclava kandeliae TaxID=3070818 RepID=A0ABV1SL95_9RHOB
MSSGYEKYEFGIPLDSSKRTFLDLVLMILMFGLGAASVAISSYFFICAVVSASISSGELFM